MPTALVKWDKREARGATRGPEGSCTRSPVVKDRPSDAGGPRFDPQGNVKHNKVIQNSMNICYTEFNENMFSSVFCISVYKDDRFTYTP